MIKYWEKLMKEMDSWVRLPDERDWVEDFGHENGNYRQVCCTCGFVFAGHKRRVTCKSCASDQVMDFL